MPKPVCGIYQIENKKNGKKYVGSSVDIHRRIIQHKSDLRTGKHCNKHIQYAWDKYGERYFCFSVLEVCLQDDKLIIEQEYLDSGNFVYNMTDYAHHPTLGRTRTEETKQKISKAHKGKVLSKEHREKLSKAHMGQSAWNKGKKMSDEARENMSKAHEGRKSEDYYWYGKKVPRQYVEKMRKKLTGRKLTEEHKRNIGDGLRGTRHSKKARENISKSKMGNKNPMYGKRPWNKGISPSKETRDKISKSLKKYFAEKKNGYD